MAARRRNRWKTVLPTVALTAFPFAAYTPTASAFFPPVVPPPPAVVDPVDPPPVVVPPVSPPPFVPPPQPPVIVVPPVIPPPVVTDRCWNHTVCTPEPGTLIGGLAGLAAALGYRAARRKGNMAKDE